jgi:hypothetical protein
MATKDFRASQIETSKIIGTGSISGTTVGIAIYSGSVASNREGSTSDSAMFSNVGSDVFLFVSGTRSNNDFTRTGATLFGGDVVISGTLYAERQVIEVDSVADGDFFVTGNMYVEPDSNSTKSVAFRNAAGNDIFIVDSTNKRIGVNVSDPDAQVEIFGTSTPHLKLSNNTDDFASFSVGANGDLTITTVDAAAGAANFGIVADGAVDVDANAGSLSLDGSAGINIGTEADVAIDINASTLDIDASGALTIDSATSIYIGGTADKPVNIDSTAFALDASTTVAIDGTGISIDATLDSNVTVTGAAKDLDIAVAGGGTQELRLASAGTGPSALHLNATAGGVNIDAIANITLDGDRLLISDPAAPGTDTLFSVSGSIGSRGTAIKGASVFGGDLVVSGASYFYDDMNLTVNKAIYFNNPGGTKDQYIKSLSDTILEIDGDDYLRLNADEQIDITTNDGTTSARIELYPKSADINRTTGATADFSANGYLLYVSGGHGTTVVGGTTNSPVYGTDVKILLSGTVGSRGGATRGTTLVAGDLAISGSATLLSTLSVGGDLLPAADDTHDLGSTSLAWQDLHLEGDILMTDAGKLETAAGDLTLSSAAGGVVIDAAGGITLDAAAASNFTTSVGALSFIASQNHADGKVILSGSSGNDSVHVTSQIQVDGKSYFTDDVQITENKKIFFDGASVSNGPYIRGNTVALTLDGDNRLLFFYDDDAVFHDTNNKTALVMNNGQVLILSGGPATSVNETDYADLAFFVSGSMGSRGTAVKGTSVFGGDSVFSGSLYKVDSVDGSLVAQIDNSGLVFPNLKVAQFGHANSKVTSDATDNLYVSGANELRLFGEDAIVLNSHDDGIVKFNKGNTEFLRITNVSDDAVIQPQVSDKDIIFKEKATGGGDEVFRIDSSAKNVLFAAGKKVTFGAATRYVGDGTSYNSNANDLVIQGSNNVILGPGANSQAFVSLGANGQFVVADGAAPANYLMITGSNLGGILSASVHNKNISIHTNNARESFSVVGTGEAVFNDPGPLGEDTVFVVSGAKGSQGTATKGTALFGGDVFISGSTHIATGSAVQGLFLSSPDGSVFRINVANDGGLLATKET